MKTLALKLISLATVIMAAGVPQVQGQFTSADVGNPAIAGSTAAVTGGFNLSGAGSEIGGTNDQFHFNYQEYSTNFDVKVRVQSLSFADAWSKAGLIARESLLGGSRFAAVFSTPSISGDFFQYRLLTNGLATNAGSFPVTYPNTWLRLKRDGNSFSGFAGINGNDWQLLGSLTLPVTGPMLVGMAVTSRDTNQTVTAQFRTFENVTGTPGVISGPLPKEPLGPSTRRTGLVISEIMYHPRTIGNFTNNSLEFIELYNSQSVSENLGGHRLTGAIGYEFPANTIIRPGQFLVVAREPSFVESHYGITGVLGPWQGVSTSNPGISTNTLPGSEGLVRLRSPANAVLLQVRYQGRNPWPIAADGSGHSLVLSHPSYGEGDPKAWSASDTIDGSPGRNEPFSLEPLAPVLINEFLAHTDDPAEDFIELYNHSRQPIDLSGAWLSDEGDTNKFRIPNGTTIGATGFVAYAQSTLGFSLSSGGERIFLVNSNQNRVIDAVDFDGQANGVSSGRYPDGAPRFSILSSVSSGTPNAPGKVAGVVINEIMYNPVTGSEKDEFVELYNHTSEAINVGGWRLLDGITFTIPADTIIPADGYLVIANSLTNLLARYSNLNATNTFGNYGGNLGNGGERLALAVPDYSFSTNTNTLVITTNINYIVVNEVTYGDGGRWGDWSDGGGSSLELIDAHSDNRQAANWADSDETAKAPWTNVEVTGSIGQTLGTANSLLLVYLLGVGECLLDDVEVRVAGGANLVSNSGFESDLTGWNIFSGSHDQSTIEPSGFGGSKSLHLRAASRGDDTANSLRSPALAGVGGANVTLRAKARWLRGYPEILLRLRGGGLEAPGRLALPLNLGSPGARNSQAIANAGPIIVDVAHSPLLPSAGEDTIITARVNDPDGLSSVVVKYRVDSTTTPITPAMFLSVPMADDGLGVDAIPGDGVFSAAVPGQVKGAAVGFYIEAVDNGGAGSAANTFPKTVFRAPGMVRCFPYDTFSRECVIRWGDPQMFGNFATYHLWVTLTAAGRWNDRHELCNTPLDGTFVYNNYRVIYNFRPQFAGSPWHAGSMSGGPTNNANRMDYVCNFPEDDRFLGVTDSVLNTVGNPGTSNDNTDTGAQSEQTSYLIFRELGVQYNYRRYIHCFVNGSHRSVANNVPGGITSTFIMEDSQQPNTDMIEAWFPDDTDGELYKIEDWFAFNDTGYNAGNEDADLGRRTNTVNGQIVPHLGAYRFMWRKRAVSPGESASDYRSFFQLLDAVSPTGIYTELATNPIPDPEALNAVADIEQWMRIFAVQHAVGNWDSYGYERGKNAFTYKPANGRFQMWTWDIDFTLGLGGHAATTSLFALGNDGDRRVQGMWNTPVFLRMYWRAFDDMINGVWNRSFLDPILNEKAAAFTQNGVVYQNSALDTVKNFITARRTYILTQLGTVATSFNVTSTNTTNNLLTLSGTAPVSVKEIHFNGVLYPVIWTSATGWTARVVLENGMNEIVLTPEPVGTNPTRTVTAVFEGAIPDPKGSLVFNEIMYNPVQPEASYVELFNKADVAFDLSGVRVSGIDYTFPLGSIMSSRQHLVLAKNRSAFLSAFTNAPAAFGEFDGNLDPGGETLTLLIPGTNGAPDVIFDQVRYEARLPWAEGANGGGPSLQLIDASQDNSRSSNWSDHEEWRFFSYTGTVLGGASPATNVAIFFFPGGGDVYIDDLMLVAGTEAGVGANLLLNPGFEETLEPWNPAGNHVSSALSTEFRHSGESSLHVVGTNSGTPNSPISAVIQRISPFASSTVCTLSGWFRPNTNGTKLNVQIRPGSGFLPSFDIRPVVATPGLANTAVDTLPAFDPVWLNELQPDNLAGPLDNAGDRDPWIELYNSGSSSINLSTYYLANNYNTNLVQWQFPAGSSIAPGEFKIVWADGEPGETSGTNLHTNFRLNGATGSVALVRMVNARPQITDYLTYANVTPGFSYGDFPDGQPFTRLVLRDPTPRGTNTARFVNVFINEWLASNVGQRADPADVQFEDWFELYNAGETSVDLGGFYLTDSTSGNTNNYSVVPANGQYVIPPGGFLLVWADNEPEQNSASRPDLHVDFALGKGGDRILLYAPDGQTLIDRVDFLGQTDDITEGRYPDGSLDIEVLSMPTPGSANSLNNENTAPELAPIGQRTAVLGQAISFTISASDADAGQALAYSIVSGAPAGATLDANTGLFSWQPAFSMVATTNFVTVQVTDSGVPPLTDSETFTLVGLPPPPTIGINGTQVSLGFQTTPGKTYRVEYKDDLGAVEWQRLNNQDYPAGAATSLIVTDQLNRPQRFYRTVQVD
jgi:hypothetical protein